MCCGGCRHIDDGPAAPQAGRPPFMCHQITDSQCLHIRSIQTHTSPPQPCPEEPVTLAGETPGQRLRVDMEVVVPGWLSDLTDCCRP